jgi:hypothetical protein
MRVLYSQRGQARGTRTEKERQDETSWMPQSQQQRHRPLLAFAASNFQDNNSCLWARGEVYETGRRLDEKEECGRPGRPSLLSPDRSVPYCRVHHKVMQRSPSRFAIYRYFDVQGFVSSQESPLPFSLRIIKESSREVPSSPRTAWFARHIKSIGVANFSERSVNAAIFFPIVRAFQIRAQSRRARLRVCGSWLTFTSGFRIAWYCCSGCLVLLTCKCWYFLFSANLT